MFVFNVTACKWVHYDFYMTFVEIGAGPSRIAGLGEFRVLKSIFESAMPK